MIYLAIALFAILLTAAGMRRCGIPELRDEDIPPPPEPPPMPEFTTLNNHSDYMVIMGAEKGREWSGSFSDLHKLLKECGEMHNENYYRQGVEDE